MRQAIPELTPSATPQQVSFNDAVRVWAKIGLINFGGPAGQIALMHHILVDEKKWLGERQFLTALNYCMLLPGPEAQQLATYAGWLLHGIRGGLVAGTLFVLPGAVVLMVLSSIYALYGQTALVAGLFFGIKAAVLAIVVEALVRIARRILGAPLLWAIAALAFMFIFFLAVPFPLIVLGAGLAGLLGGRLFPHAFGVAGRTGDEQAPRRNGVAPSWGRALALTAGFAALWFAPLALVAALAGIESAFFAEGLFFSKMAVVTFGGAYAVLAYVAQQAVETYAWLQPGEMLDGLGLAETTPGPLILVLQFVGFLAAFRNPAGLDPLLAGLLGASLTLWVTFVPCFLWIFLGAPHVERIGQRRIFATALSAITAAVVGVILNLAIWFALHVVFASVQETALGPLRLFVPDLASLNVAALGLALAAMIAMFRFHLGLVAVLLAASAAGLALSYAGLTG